MAAAEAPADQALTKIEVVEAGELYAAVRIHKRLLRCEVEQTITVWSSGARVDLETRIFWWGERNQQVRLVLPGIKERAAITYGAPFYGVGWTEVAEGTAPRNSDEIAPADQLNYREVQGWVHVAGDQGGATILTTHPAFHYEDAELAAVLMRTSPSCGDHRLFWENAGEQVFTFTILPGEADWRAARTQELAAQHLRQPAARLVQAQNGALPPAQGLLQVQGASVALSSLYEDAESGATLVRVWETAGTAQMVTFTGSLSSGNATTVNLLNEASEPAPVGQPGDWRLDLPAWSIRTVRFTR